MHAAALRAGAAIPDLESTGMGTVAWRSGDGSRSVTLRRALRRAPPGEAGQVTWGFWSEKDVPRPTTLIEELAAPTDARADYFLQLLLQWVVEGVPEKELLAAIHSRQPPHLVP